MPASRIGWKGNGVDDRSGRAACRRNPAANASAFPGRRGGRSRFLAAALVLAAVALTACQSAGSCIEQVPDALRADVVRYVVATHMVREAHVPRRDRDLARQLGADPKELSEERAREVKRYASTYALCVNRLIRD